MWVLGHGPVDLLVPLHNYKTALMRISSLSLQNLLLWKILLKTQKLNILEIIFWTDFGFRFLIKHSYFLENPFPVFRTPFRYWKEDMVFGVTICPPEISGTISMKIGILDFSEIAISFVGCSPFVREPIGPKNNIS